MSCLFLLAAGLLMAYNFQLAETNEYMGYRTFSIDLPYVIALITAIFFIGMLMPAAIRRPSDFFTLLYGLFVLLPYVTLFPIRNPVSLQDFMLFFSALAGPFFVVRIVSVVIPPLRVPGLITQKALVFLLAFLCVTGMFLALSSPTASAGFDLATSYERRIQGRDVFSAGTPLAYLNAAIVNGFAPFLAFVAGWQRRAWLLAFSLCCGLTFFYLLGLKAPLLFIAVASVIGYSARRGKVHAMVRTIYILLFTAFILFLFEYFFFGYSLVGDYFIRRAFSVPAWLSSAYFEFMTLGSTPAWLPLQGISSPDPITFLVGEGFLGFPGLNANTNAFIYQLAAGGIPMYALTILLVACVFALLDATYACRQNPALVYLGFSYAILLTEQAATTALVSSGIGMLVMLVVFSGAGERTNARSCSHHRLVEP
ncbi:hypothetical protein TMS3_0112750 [Pseudomonas taeanensis MS-3]|uniref:Uncharacterized protein n=2 Tax=Pseudomonas taeanensis TaxID=574962 RepID=A0A0A1YK74_9PSED|nr:hypothetical protein TMS3_0112750 [Pseudomonas taeanensis MS-3]